MLLRCAWSIFPVSFFCFLRSVSCPSRPHPVSIVLSRGPRGRSNNVKATLAAGPRNFDVLPFGRSVFSAQQRWLLKAVSPLGAGSQKNHVSVRGQSDWGCCTTRAWPRSKHSRPAHPRIRPGRLVAWANLRAHEGFVRRHMRPLLVTRVCHGKGADLRSASLRGVGEKRGQHGWERTGRVDGWMDDWGRV